METVVVGGYIFPVVVEYAKKKNSSAVIRDGRIILRISSRQNVSDRKKHVEELRAWAVNRIRKNPEKFVVRSSFLEHGQNISFFGSDYKVRIENTANKRASVVMRDNVIVCRVPAHFVILERNEVVRRLTYKMLVKIVSHRFEVYVKEINDKHFCARISKIRIKNFKGRWGCCSANNELDFSFSLLRAPLPIIEYVVVHELAHTVHRDHSARFWKRVEKTLPDYRSRMRWLNEHGDSLKF